MKKHLALALVAFMGYQAFGAISADKRYKLNSYMGQVAGETQLGTLIDEGGTSSLSKDGFSPLKTVQATYDYSIHGGASTALIEIGGVSIPDNAIIVHSFLDILTQPTSATNASIAIHAESANDILTTTAIGSLTAGRYAGTSDWAVANMKKTTAARAVKVGITLGALTDGKFKVYLQYVVSE